MACVVLRLTSGTEGKHMTVIIILLVIWALVAVVGFAFKGLLWLAIAGIILLVGTLVVGITRRAINRRPKN